MVQRYNPDYVMHAARFAPFARENDHGEFVKFSDYEALKAERDALADRVKALAVENAALEAAVDGFNQELYGKGFEVLGWHLNGDTEPLDNWFGENDWNPETPVTDAALAAIEVRILPPDIAEIIDSGDLETICYEHEHPSAERIRLALYNFRQLREAK